MKHKIKNISHDERARAFWFLTSVCLFSLGAYIYAVNSTTRNVALRSELERQVTNLNTELAGLEFQYIKLKNDITLEIAQQLGYREVRKPLYLSRNSNHTLSFNIENR